MFKCTNDNGVKQIDPKTKGTKVLKTVRTQETAIENPSLNITKVSQVVLFKFILFKFILFKVVLFKSAEFKMKA